jgi:SSS family solute:Na+ symporter
MDKDTQLTRWGLLVSALFSVVLALLVPSVIKLWYTIGTVLVPGLLVPLVTSYFDRLRVSGHYALSAMLAAWLTSLAWLGAGWTQELGATDRYPFGIEPMLPGLAVSLIVWGAGWMSRRCGERAS